jgi:hypothetical protein
MTNSIPAFVALIVSQGIVHAAAANSFIIEERFPTLCATSQQFLGVFVMLAIIASFILYLASCSLSEGHKWKPKLRLAAIFTVAFSAIGMAVYVLAPIIRAYLLGEPASLC